MHRRTLAVVFALVVPGGLLVLNPPVLNALSAGRAQAPLLPGLPEPSAMRISQQDFKTLLLAREKPIVVDVRTADSFREGHIPGAVLIPFEGRTSLPPESDELVARLKASTATVVTYCACHGETTSVRVAILLQLHGVKNVRVLTGGWADWINDHNAIEK